MCVGSGTAGAGSHLKYKPYYFIIIYFFLRRMYLYLYFHLTGPARTRPFLEEDLAGGDEGLLAAAVDLGDVLF